VNIYTSKTLPSRRYIKVPGGGLIPGQRRAESLGSGFIIEPNGLILTNWHVVSKAESIDIRLFDESRFEASVVGYDPKTDVALLQATGAEGLPHLEFADSDTFRVGDWVVAIGNPLGLTSTVTAGIISATGRKSLPMGGDMMYQDFIQTDASINPGNSGGPLLNLDGKVVGINTAVHAEGQGLGFAIPINMVREIMPRLKAGGRVERSWLGIYIDPVPAALRKQLELPKQGGVLVTRVVRGGPAQKAGLKPGDIVLTIDQTDVAGPDELAWMAGNVGVGKQIVLRVNRAGQMADLNVTLGALPE
jgi:S1-C subfamily serine protease